MGFLFYRKKNRTGTFLSPWGAVLVTIAVIEVLCGPKAFVSSHSQPIGYFDKDDREDCRKMLSFCQSDLFGHIFIQCAASCVRYLEEEGCKGTADDPEEFYSLELRTFQDRKKIDTERFEGYVTVVAIVPLIPGMAGYYYEMMEHLHTSFHPSIETVVIPVDVGLGIHIRMHEDDPKVLVLEEEGAPEYHSMIKFLYNVKPRSGAASKDIDGNVVQMTIPTDRVTVYIVSADAYFIERLVSPTLAIMKEKISVYRKTVDYEL